jgi:hypothetical protein
MINIIRTGMRTHAIAKRLFVGFDKICRIADFEQPQADP